jgi:hypothetical protein
MRGILLITAFTLAAAEACSTDITGTDMRSNQLSARSDASASASRTVPFKAHYVARIVGFGPGPGCDGRLFLEGAGTATELGNFTITLGFCGRGDGTLDTGTGTFVAANGDLLYITFTGVSDGGYPTLHFTSYVTFTGGTGRFDGTTGTATVNGSFDDLTGLGPADWNGELTLANGKA